jgi:hypothetical protein
LCMSISSYWPHNHLCHHKVTPLSWMDFEEEFMDCHNCCILLYNLYICWVNKLHPW